MLLIVNSPSIVAAEVSRDVVGTWKMELTQQQVNENLKDVVNATKEAAKEAGASIIDLNAASTKYHNSTGAEKSATYNLNSDDFTHLNSEGSVVDEALPALRKYVEPVDVIEEALEIGEYYFPETIQVSSINFVCYK